MITFGLSTNTMNFLAWLTVSLVMANFTASDAEFERRPNFRSRQLRVISCHHFT